MDKKLTVNDLLRCSKPLYFEDGFEGYEYSSAGTYFFANYKGVHFAVTAKHCLRNRDKETVRLMFDEMASNEDYFLAIKNIHAVKDPPEGPQDWSDIVIFELDSTQLSESIKTSPWFLDFDALIQREVTFRNRSHLITRGFPTELGGIDYDSLKIVIQAFAVDGYYNGKTAYAGMHFFEFFDRSQIRDPNGLSGSPVFIIERLPEGLDYKFAGMILRAGIDATFCRFLDCGFIFRAVKNAFDVTDPIIPITADATGSDPTRTSR